MGAYASSEQNLVVKQLAGGSGTGTVTGTALDTAGYSEALIILTLGNVTASGTLAVKIQDAVADTGYTDLTGAAFTTKSGAVDNGVYVARLKLDGNTCKRWIKCVAVVGTDTVDFTVVAVLSGKQYLPQAVNAVEWTV